MGKRLSTKRPSRRGQYNNEYQEENNIYQLEPVSRRVKQEPFTLVAKNDEQTKLINAIKNFFVVCTLGGAGSGKTFVSTVLAAQALKEGNTDKLVLIRPNESLGHSLGMLKGSLFEKQKPWLAPYLPALLSVFSLGELQYLMKEDVAKIEMVAVEHLRGLSFNNTWVVADEVQNISYEALKCLLLRIGENSKMVLCGDIAQCDIDPDTSGLHLLLDIDEAFAGHKPFKVVELRTCVRSPVAAYFMEAIEQLEADADK